MHPSEEIEVPTINVSSNNVDGNEQSGFNKCGLVIYFEISLDFPNELINFSSIFNFIIYINIQHKISMLCYLFLAIVNIYLFF